MATVHLEKLEKIYPGDRKRPSFRAVKGIDLQIKDQEFMVLVGPSGCGKSTTLRMIAGLEDVTSGSISIGDQAVDHLPPKDRDIAMVFQNYALYPHMSVYENMAFSLKLAKHPGREIHERVEDAAKILGLENLLERKPKALSGGQRQRVAVGRAIVREPKVFLFDEPLSNLDAKMRVSMRVEISRLHARLNATMIYVTHDQVEAMSMGDRICVMNEGEIMQVSDPVDLYNNPRNMFVASFIGSPPMNFLHGMILEQDSELFFAENPGSDDSKMPIRFPLNEELANKLRNRVNQSIVFGIRPENVKRKEPTGSYQSEGYSESVNVMVDLREPHGAETLLYLKSGSHSLIAKVESDSSDEENAPVEIQFNLRKAKFFDPETEEAL